MVITEREKLGEIHFDEAKFKELILYIADKCSNDPEFGATKLNKILFYADFLAYGLFERSITGATYFKLGQGPAPKEMVQVQKQMIEDGDIAIQPKKYFNQEQKRTIPLRDAILDRFSAREISLVDSLIGAFLGFNAEELSRLSHREACWQIASDKEEIPYTAVFLSNIPLSNEEERHGLELAKVHGWPIQSS